MGRVTARVPVRRITLTDDADAAAPAATGAPFDEFTGPDRVVVEEPLELRVGGASVTVTMRTPGDDVDLALGWLATEGGLVRADDIAEIRPCQDLGEDGLPTYNVLDVTLAPGRRLRAGAVRERHSSSACGVCGTASIDNIRTAGVFDLAADDVHVDPAVLATLPERLRAGQTGFERTGGTHAAGLFAADGTLLCLREDVGRHNAVDKVIGWAVRRDELPASGRILFVSGRAGFEITQKCLLAGIPVLASVSATTSLSVELARRGGLTLVGFARPPRLTVYADPGRLAAPGRSARPGDPARA